MKRLHILAVGGLLGVASLWLVPFEILLPEIAFTWRMRLLALIQPAVLTLIAIFVGGTLAPKVGLGTPLIDAVSSGSDVTATLRRIIPYAALVGGACALILVLFAAFVSPEIGRTSPLGARLNEFSMPLITKLFYGGITEELLTRWGLMSFVAWVGWRMCGRSEKPSDAIFWIALTGSAMIFALGHLPLLKLITPNPQSLMIAAVLLGNALPGMLFGWLFWRKGIEAAILAHMLAHLFSSAFV